MVKESTDSLVQQVRPSPAASVPALTPLLPPLTFFDIPSPGICLYPCRCLCLVDMTSGLPEGSNSSMEKSSTPFLELSPTCSVPQHSWFHSWLLTLRHTYIDSTTHSTPTPTVPLCYQSWARIWALPRQEPHIINCFVRVPAQFLAPGRV